MAIESDNDYMIGPQVTLPNGHVVMVEVYACRFMSGESTKEFRVTEIGQKGELLGYRGFYTDKDRALRHLKRIEMSETAEAEE